MVQGHLDCAGGGAAAARAGSGLQPRSPAAPSGGGLPGLISSPSGGSGGGALRAVTGPTDHSRPSKEPASACADGEIPAAPAAGTADAAVGTLSAGVAASAPPPPSASRSVWVGRADGTTAPPSSAGAERVRLGGSSTSLDRSGGAWAGSLRRVRALAGGIANATVRMGGSPSRPAFLAACTWCAAASDRRRRRRQHRSTLPTAGGSGR